MNERSRKSMEMWPNNPIAKVLREFDQPISCVTVAAAPQPFTPLGMTLQWCKDSLTGTAPDFSHRIDVDWDDPRKPHIWCAELAWATGSPLLVRIDLRPGARLGRPNILARWLDPTPEELFDSVEKEDWLRDHLIAMARASGLTTWSWCCPADRYIYGGYHSLCVEQDRREDASLRADGSRSLNYPWLDWVECPIQDITPIPAGEESHTREYDMRSPPVENPAAARRRQAVPRQGRSIPDEVLNKIATLGPDFVDMIERIRSDIRLAADWEERLADFVLNALDGRLQTSPLTFDEMVALTACLEGRAYGTPRDADDLDP